MWRCEETCVGKFTAFPHSKDTQNISVGVRTDSPRFYSAVVLTQDLANPSSIENQHLYSSFNHITPLQLHNGCLTAATGKHRIVRLPGVQTIEEQLLALGELISSKMRLLLIALAVLASASAVLGETATERTKLIAKVEFSPTRRPQLHAASEPASHCHTQQHAPLHAGWGGLFRERGLHQQSVAANSTPLCVCLCVGVAWPSLTRAGDATTVSGPGGAGHALQFRDHVLLKKDFKVGWLCGGIVLCVRVDALVPHACLGVW